MTVHREMVGSFVMMAREAMELKPKPFADRLGITVQALWNIEAGRAYPSVFLLKRLAEEFGFSTDWFVRGVRAGMPQDSAERLVRAELRLAMQAKQEPGPEA